MPSWRIAAQGILCDISYNISTLIGHSLHQTTPLMLRGPCKEVNEVGTIVRVVCEGAVAESLGCLEAFTEELCLLRWKD